MQEVSESRGYYSQTAPERTEIFLWVNEARAFPDMTLPCPHQSTKKVLEGFGVLLFFVCFTMPSEHPLPNSDLHLGSEVSQEWTPTPSTSHSSPLGAQSFAHRSRRLSGSPRVLAPFGHEPPEMPSATANGLWTCRRMPPSACRWCHSPREVTLAAPQHAEV